MRDVTQGQRDELRYEPTGKRVRATVGDTAVVDSTHALLVWEPRRIVPSYAVSDTDVTATVEPGPAAPPPPTQHVLHPGIPFAAHSTPGESLSLRAGGRVLDGAAFRPADPELRGYLVLDFPAFDGWYEEDDPVVSHPRDPFHRVDARRSSRHVRIGYQGRLLAESTRATLVFETNLPTRYYLPPEDLLVELAPGRRKTACAYKGHAAHWSIPERPDIAWSYPEPLPDMPAIRGLVAFYDEIVDVTVDGEPLEHPDTPFARALREEFTAG